MRTARTLALVLALTGRASRATQTTTYDPEDVTFEDETSLASLPASEDVTRAEEALARGDLSAARALLERSAPSHARDARHTFDLALVLELSDEAERAEAKYREALALRPNFPEALNNLGLLLYDGGRSAESKPLLERAIALRPSYGEAHGNLGLVLEALGDLEGALARMRVATRLRPDDAFQRLNRGQIARRLGVADEARTELLRAIQLSATSSRIRREAASGLVDLGAASQAYDALAAAARTTCAEATSDASKVTCAESELDAARIAVRMRRGAEAERHAQRATEVLPAYAEAHLLYGHVLRARGDSAGAERAFEAALRHATNDAHRQDARRALLDLSR